MSTDRADIREIAEEVAQVTVTRTFLMLGVDASDPDAVRAMQADFAFVRSQREAAIALRRNAVRAGWSLLVAALVAVGGYLWATFHLPGPGPQSLP